MSTSDAELARLRAQAAQAAADAAQAKADAAQAALDAALAAGNSPASDTPPASGNSPAPEDPSASPSDAASAETTSAENPQRADGGASAPSQTDSAEKELGEYAAAVRDGYAFDAPTLTLGAYLEDGTPEPRALVQMPLGMLNRHGLVAGATGTGKTRTLQLMTEGLSASGIPVFITDIKGDLTGLLEPGQASEKLSARVAALGQPWQPASFPVELFSLGGSGDGVPVRTSVTDFGPILMSKVLGLNETQESALSLIFSWADSQGFALIDLADLRATVAYLTSEEGKGELAGIGGVSPATAGVILREISALQAQGADAFFGEPAFETEAFLRTSADGRGVVSCLELPDVRSQPALFSTFVMWLLASLFQDLPEVGDADKPKLVFFFDEAHLLFADASKEFLNQVVQTVRLIRSKGVGIFFVTQSPKDVPDDVLAQLGSRVQHALRAHTPNDQKALKATVDTFPSSPLDLLKVLPGLGTGEAIVTVLDPKGRPTPVAPTRLWAPAAVMGPSSPGAVSSCLAASPFMAKYKDPVDPESAFELLAARVEAEKAAAETAKEQAKAEKEAEKAAAEAEKRRLKELEAEAKAAAKAAEREEREAAKEAERQRRADERRAERQEKRKEAAIDSVVRSIGRSLGSSITRTLFGSRRR
ncbi:ATPase [Peptidiphaga gingivicola]|uniref:ATPase n=1 Tax=Peptidiphaga gingivicola TaxID=2741497 RepID=A0A179B531_9ACTO|nr:helicase HerA-like domain-containing protein [Peptidiphaga gingivicola]OAP86802.1 ATPase [Peptidiphaga gingivicola]